MENMCRSGGKIAASGPGRLLQASLSAAAPIGAQEQPAQTCPWGQSAPTCPWRWRRWQPDAARAMFSPQSWCGPPAASPVQRALHSRAGWAVIVQLSYLSV